jgi:hypothetical protein
MAVTNTLAYYYAKLKMYLASFRVHAQSVCAVYCTLRYRINYSCEESYSIALWCFTKCVMWHTQACLEPTLEWSPITGYAPVGSSMPANSRLGWN